MLRKHQNIINSCRGKVWTKLKLLEGWGKYSLAHPSPAFSVNEGTVCFIGFVKQQGDYNREILYLPDSLTPPKTLTYFNRTIPWFTVTKTGVVIDSGTTNFVDLSVMSWTIGCTHNYSWMNEDGWFLDAKGKFGRLDYALKFTSISEADKIKRKGLILVTVP